MKIEAVEIRGKAKEEKLEERLRSRHIYSHSFFLKNKIKIQTNLP